MKRFCHAFHRPANQSEGITDQNLPWTLVAIGFVLIALISVWAVWRRRTHPHLLFGWSWFVISLLPVIGLIQVGIQAYADRYAYIPHIGLFVAIVWEIDGWVAAWKTGRIVAAVIAFTTLLACGLLTHAQVGYWASDATPGRGRSVTPDSGFAHIWPKFELKRVSTSRLSTTFNGPSSPAEAFTPPMRISIGDDR